MLVETLIKHGAGVTAVASDGATPLHHACQKRFSPDHAMSVQALLDNGADPGATMNKGQTPLHVACRNSSYELAHLLIATGKLNVNQRDSDGKTALIEAANAPEPLRTMLRNCGATE